MGYHVAKAEVGDKERYTIGVFGEKDWLNITSFEDEQGTKLCFQYHAYEQQEKTIMEMEIRDRNEPLLYDALLELMEVEVSSEGVTSAEPFVSDTYDRHNLQTFFNSLSIVNQYNVIHSLMFWNGNPSNNEVILKENGLSNLSRERIKSFVEFLSSIAHPDYWYRKNKYLEAEQNYKASVKVKLSIVH